MWFCLCGGKERDEPWMAQHFGTGEMSKKFQWQPELNTYLWVACAGHMWVTHQQYEGDTGSLWCRQLGNRSEDMGNACHLAGNKGHSWDIKPTAVANMDLRFSAVLSITHIYLQTSLSVFSFFQENIGNCITLPISTVHLCLFLYSLCTGNVFWLQFKTTSVPPKRSSLL